MTVRAFTKSWLPWLLMVLAMVLGTFHRTALTVVVDQLMADLKLTGAALGTLGSVFFWVYTAMQIPAGYLADRLGARCVVTAGLFLVGNGGLLFALAPSFAVATLGRICLGLGSSVFFLALVRLQTNFFSPARFATLTGLAAFLADGGGLLAGSPFAFLVQRLGWRPAYAAIALATLAASLLAWLFVRDRPAGLPEAAATAPATDRHLLLGPSLRAVVKNPGTWPPFLTVLGLNSALLTFQGLWSVPYLMQVYGLDRAQAAVYPSIIAAGLMLGGLASGYLADYWGRPRRLLIGFLSTYAAVWAIFAFLGGGKPPACLLPPLTFLMGFSAASMIVALACAKEANPPELAALASGTVNVGNFLAVALLQPVAGWLLDKHWTGTMVAGMRHYPLAAYRSAFLLSLAVALVSLAGAFLIRHK